MRKRRGFSLLEVLFASFLAMVCMLIVGATLPISTVTKNKTDLANRAMSLAQKELEAVKASGYANITATQLFANKFVDSATPTTTDTYTFTNVDSTAVDSPALLLPNGTGTLKFEQVDLELKRLTVTITWKEVSGTQTKEGTSRMRTRTLVAGTMVANL